MLLRKLLSIRGNPLPTIPSLERTQNLVGSEIPTLTHSDLQSSMPGFCLLLVYICCTTVHVHPLIHCNSLQLVCSPAHYAAICYDAASTSCCLSCAGTNRQAPPSWRCLPATMQVHRPTPSTPSRAHQPHLGRTRSSQSCCLLRCHCSAKMAMKCLLLSRSPPDSLQHGCNQVIIGLSIQPMKRC